MVHIFGQITVSFIRHSISTIFGPIFNDTLLCVYLRQFWHQFGLSRFGAPIVSGWKWCLIYFVNGKLHRIGLHLSLDQNMIIIHFRILRCSIIWRVIIEAKSVERKYIKSTSRQWRMVFALHYLKASVWWIKKQLTKKHSLLRTNCDQGQHKQIKARKDTQWMNENVVKIDVVTNDPIILLGTTWR